MSEVPPYVGRVFSGWAELSHASNRAKCLVLSQTGNTKAFLFVGLSPGGVREQTRYNPKEIIQVPCSRLPPWRQPKGKWMVSLVNSHTSATSNWWHLWEIDLIFAFNSTPGWSASDRFVRVGVGGCAP